RAGRRRIHLEARHPGRGRGRSRAPSTAARRRHDTPPGRGDRDGCIGATRLHPSVDRDRATFRSRRVMTDAASDATTYSRLLGLLGPYKTVVAMTVDALCMVLFAKEIKPLIDKLFVVRDPHVIFWMPIIIISIFFARSI